MLMKNVQPEELIKQRIEFEKILDERYYINIRKRKRASLIIGLCCGIFANIFPNIVVIAQGRWGTFILMVLMVILAIAWSYVVQFKNIGAIWSVLIFGGGGIILVFSITRAPAFLWWFAILTSSAVITLLNDIYKD